MKKLSTQPKLSAAKGSWRMSPATRAHFLRAILRQQRERQVDAHGSQPTASQGRRVSTTTSQVQNGPRSAYIPGAAAVEHPLDERYMALRFVVSRCA